MANSTQLFKNDEEEKARPSVSDEELRHITGIGEDEEGAMDREAGNGSDEDLAEQEGLKGNTGADDKGSAKADTGTDTEQVRNEEESPSDTVGNGYQPSGGKGKKGKRSLKSKLAKHKGLLIGAGGGGGIVAIGLILLLLLLSSLKLPNITQNITNYEFTRITRIFNSSAERTSDEALAVEAADDSLYGQLKTKFTTGYSNIRQSTWGKLDRFRPSQVIKSLNDKGGAGLTLNFKASNIPGRSPIFTGATINGTLYEMEQPGGLSKWVPGLRGYVTAKNQVAFTQSFYPELSSAMENTNVGGIIRNATSNRIRKAIGISLIGWEVGKFKGKNAAQAELEETRETAQAVDEDPATVPDNATTEEISDADKAAAQAEADTLNDDTKLAAAIKNGGVADATDKAISSSIKSSLTKDVLGAVDPLYAIATPVCIVYDGSVQESGPTITNQVNQQQATYYHYASAADQQKYGTVGSDADPVALDNAISATNDQIGDITKSYPYIRASNGSIDTSDIASVEAGSDGSFQYSLINAAGLSGDAASVANYIVHNFCSALTSTASAIGIGILNIGAAIVSFGGTEAGEEAAGEGAAQFIKVFVTSTVKDLFAKQTESIVKDGIATTIERSALSRAYQFAFKQGLVVAGTVGATELASLIVSERANVANDGFAQGPNAVNEADSGANINAGETCRIQLFCRPLTETEVCQSNAADTAFRDDQTKKESITQRYFALSNGESLAAHSAMALSSLTSNSAGSSLTRLGSLLLRPLSIVGSILNIFSARAYAATNCNANSTNYGNVQFGWSQDEENLINGNTSYAPLENQQVLDQATNGGEIAIAQKYAKCFGWKYDSGGNGDIDPTDTAGNLQPDMDNATLGKLLSNGDITRDNNGNVNETGGDCSPQNLGPNNSAYGAQMVFRWRLAMSYDSTLDQLTGIQNPTN